MKIVYVNGFLIRNTLDDDFSSIHYHGQEITRWDKKWYIPKGEVWIDQIYKDETAWLLKTDHAIERYLRKKPNKSTTSHQKNQKIDTHIDYRHFAKSICRPGPIPKFIIKSETNGDIPIQYVNGSIVRQYIDPEFVMGGHDLVYSYITNQEIWIDILMNPKEIPYILLHEKTERELMAKNGKTYDIAHAFATVQDMDARVRDGYGYYPGYAIYPWRGLNNKEIIKKYVISRREKKHR